MQRLGQKGLLKIGDLYYDPANPNPSRPEYNIGRITRYADGKWGPDIYGDEFYDMSAGFRHPRKDFSRQMKLYHKGLGTQIGGADVGKNEHPCPEADIHFSKLYKTFPINVLVQNY